MGGGGSPPKGPTAEEQRQAQTETNIDTARANAFMGYVDQTNPHGSLEYIQGDDQFVVSREGPQTNDAGEQGYFVPTFTAVETLSPAEQQKLDLTNEADTNLLTLARDQSDRLNESLKEPFNLDGLPERGAVVDAPDYAQYAAGPQYQTYGDAPDLATSYGDEADYADQRSRVEEALFSRLQPSLDRDRASLETQLINSGVNKGSELYDREMARFTEGATDARMQAILAAGQEQNRLAALDAQRAAFSNNALQQTFGNQNLIADQANTVAGQAFADRNFVTGANNQLADQAFQNANYNREVENQNRGVAIDERAYSRDKPINEISAILSGSQVNSPNFGAIGGPQMPNFDMAGAMQQQHANELAAWQAQQAQQGGLFGGALGGLFQLGAGALSGGYFS